MRKVSYVLAAAAAMLAMSCNKQDSVSPVQAVGGDPCILNVTLNSPMGLTKATEADTDAEAFVKQIDIVIFDSGTGLNTGYKRFSSGEISTADGKSTVSMEAKSGSVDVYALVNYSETISDAELASKDAFLKKNFDLKYQAKNDFEMIGNTSAVLSTKNDNEVNIYVDRAVSRIKIGKITRQFENTTLASYPMVIDGIYVSDGVYRADFQFGKDVVTKAAFFNPWGSVASNLPIAYKEDLNLDLVNGQSLNMDVEDYYLYTMPNPYATTICASDFDSHADMLAAAKDYQLRGTMLIIIAHITLPSGDVQQMSYTIRPNVAFEKNHSYDFDEIVLSNLGNNIGDWPDDYIKDYPQPDTTNDPLTSNPDGDGTDKGTPGVDEDGTITEEVKTVSVTFNLFVNDWEQVLCASEGQESGSGKYVI